MDLKIVVPSRKRSTWMPDLLKLIPDAFVTVEESEMDDYLKYVHVSKLIPHPPLGGIGPIRAWIMEEVDADFICQIDDDLKSVSSYVWKRPRKLTATEISALILNGAMVSKDLDLPMFSWSCSLNPMNYTNCQPLHTQKWVGQVVVLNKSWYGPSAGRIMYDSRLREGEDGDLCLQALLEARVVLKDMRFDWDFGNTGGNPGGLQGMRTKEALVEDWTIMKKKWGPYLADGGDDGGNSRIAVNRKSKMAIA